MKFEQYFNIPIKQKKQQRYLMILKIIMSLISGIFLILLKRIFKPTSQQTSQSSQIKQQQQQSQYNNDNQLNLQIAILLFSSTIIKSIFFINFKNKSGQSTPNKATLRSCEVIIPALLKTFLHIGLIKICSVYLTSLDGAFLLLLNFYFIQYYRIKVIKENFNLCKDITLIILFTIAMVLITKKYSYDQNLVDNLFLITFGTLTTISYYDLNSKIFEIYKPSVEEFIAKQYLPQLVINLVYLGVLICMQQQFRHLIFIVENFPYVIMFVILAGLSEYAILEFLTKKKFGELVYTVFSGFLWAELSFAIKSDRIQIRNVYGIIILIFSWIINSNLIDFDCLFKNVAYLMQSEKRNTKYEIE